MNTSPALMDFRDKLLNRESAKQAVLMDFDGPVYMGRFYHVPMLRGKSVVDLALVLIKHYVSPWSNPGFLAKNVNLFRQALVSDDESALLNYFCSECIGGMKVSTVRRAARHLPKYDHPLVRDCISAISQRSDVFIVSKTISPILGVYSEQLNGSVTEYIGNELLTEGDTVKGLNSEVMLTQDRKKERAAQILTGYDSALIVINSDDDLGMREAALDARISFMCVGVNPRSERVRGLSDIVLKSWVVPHLILSNGFQ